MLCTQGGNVVPMLGSMTMGLTGGLPHLGPHRNASTALRLQACTIIPVCAAFPQRNRDKRERITACRLSALSALCAHAAAQFAMLHYSRSAISVTIEWVHAVGKIAQRQIYNGSRKSKMRMH